MDKINFTFHGFNVSFSLSEDGKYKIESVTVPPRTGNESLNTLDKIEAYASFLKMVGDKLNELNKPIAFKWTPKLLRMIKESHASLKTLTSDYYSFPVTQETIELDMALNRGEILIDYDKIDELYIDQNELFQFLYHTGAFSLDDAIKKFTPVVAYDIDGVLADIQPEIRRICPEWDELSYEVDAGYNDFNYLGLALKDKPKNKIEYLITSRPTKYTEDTRIWLNLHNIDFSLLIHSENKLETMKHFDIDILIEDNPHTFEAVNSGGKICYLYDCTYNRHVETNLRVKNLEEFEGLVL